MKRMRQKTRTIGYCMRCGKTVPIKEKAGVLRSLRGILMFYTGVAPGKRESQITRCALCNGELPAA